MSDLFVGAPIRRKEDPDILLGRARYVSDVTAPGMLVATVVRSPFAHALVKSIDAAEALATDGVEAVYTAADLGAALINLASFGQFPPTLLNMWKPAVRAAPVTTMATDKVRFVGEPVALVVASDRYVAEDAGERVHVDYEPLEPVVDVERAMGADAPDIHDEAASRALIKTDPWRGWCTSPEQWTEEGELDIEWERNVGLDMHVHMGDVDGAFATAAHTFADRFYSHRYTGVPLEGRGMLAIPDTTDGSLKVWSSCQLPYFHRALISEALNIPEDKVRVAQPYLGGGFGMKAGLYSEDILIPFAALKLGRPVKWLEDKREHFQSSNHSREQLFDAEVAVDAEGKLLGLRYSVIIDAGAYLTFPVVLPYLGMCHVFGPYKLPALDVRFKSVFTNKVTSAPYRGAGRPEVVFMLNRLIDRIARELGIDAAEVRRRNFIRPDEMPFDAGILYRDGSPMILDSGDYPGALERNLEAIGYDGFRADQARAREEGRYIGIGMCCNIEAGGLGPVELARIEITRTGDVVLHLGVVDTGQGQRTVFAQICADAIGIDVDRVTVKTGDSGGIAYSRGTYHSRAAVTAGNAVLVAARRVEKKLKVLAGHHLEASPEDLELVDGAVRVKGAPDVSISLERCAQLAVPDGSSVAGATATAGAILGLPPDMSPGIDETGHFVAKSVVWGNASHAAIVEVDPELGTLKILRYVVVHDCGRVLNPMIVDGQIHGGVAQGIGGAVLEQLVYDDNGQLATSTMADYMLPRAADIPEIEIIQMESPSPLNPLGVKGAGEGGTIGPPAALAAAVEDALAPFGARITETPLSPAIILKALRAAKAREG